MRGIWMNRTSLHLISKKATWSFNNTISDCYLALKSDINLAKHRGPPSERKTDLIRMRWHTSCLLLLRWLQGCRRSRDRRGHWWRRCLPFLFRDTPSWAKPYREREMFTVLFVHLMGFKATLSAQSTGGEITALNDTGPITKIRNPIAWGIT